MASIADQPAEKQHLDIHGNVFELPTFTMKEIHDAIPAHCFKPSTLRSMAYVFRDFGYFFVLAYLALTYIPTLPNIYLRFAAWVAYTTLQGFVCTGIWILGHECGHGAFSKSKTLNYTMGLILHSFLVVPFHSWRISHSQHHKATGNLERDTAFVPHTRESWLKYHFGKKAEETMVEFAELAEDSPISALWHDIVHQVLGWPGYLLLNLTGQKYGGAKGLKISHYYWGEDSVFYKKDELPYVMLSDLGVAVMIAALIAAGQIFGNWNVALIWLVPYLWVNNWIIAITFLQHTDGNLPHYNNSTWSFARGATATIDRDLGFLDTHFFHDIIGTHVCHHLVSTIPFYKAAEASVHIKRVMGKHYKADLTTPFWTAFWNNQRSCKFVEESEGMEGSGVYMFRNLFNKEGQTQPINKVKGGEEKKEVKKEEVKSGMATAMASARSADARRRLSHSANLHASIPLLAEA